MNENDRDSMINHVALECMSAIESRDKELFKQSFHILISDILDQLQKDEKKE